MKIMVFSIFLFMATLLYSESAPPGAFSITRIHYDGGGDWYADPSSLPNMLEYLKDNTNIAQVEYVSIIERLNMWEKSFKMFKEAPLLEQSSTDI